MDGFSIIGIGISAFVATNIDDIFVLMLFYANSKFKPFQIVLGQYLGIGLLVSIEYHRLITCSSNTKLHYWVIRTSTNFYRVS